MVVRQEGDRFDDLKKNHAEENQEGGRRGFKGRGWMMEGLQRANPSRKGSGHLDVGRLGGSTPV